MDLNLRRSVDFIDASYMVYYRGNHGNRLEFLEYVFRVYGLMNSLN